MKGKNQEPRFVVCIQSDDCEDLEVRRLYQVLPNEAAAADGLLRVVDESGEDYLYPAKVFLAIELPQTIERALLTAA